MNFKKINNVSGWIIFAIAYVTYLMSMEPTASLWDCGEFLLSAYKLEVAHAPGAPLFAMLGRIFSLFASDVTMVAATMNSMSALVSAFTILFLFWSITHFAKKIVVGKDISGMHTSNLITIIGAGFVGALTYTFSDTFWFSAVEGEVYAMSSFFTAIVFWAALKWEDNADNPHADRWMILIFYLMGLSIGVHLLNLLTIPAIIMVYYFKRYEPTLKGGIIAFLIGCVVLAIVQFGVIQYVPIIASKFELLFVNSFKLPFNSGLIAFIIVMVAAIIFLLKYAKKTGKYLLHLSVLSLVFVMIGYSSFVAVVLRSKADVPIDMGNPDNVISLIPYLQRDQYGSQPIVTGPYFTSKLIDIKKDRDYYAVDKDENGKDFYRVVSFKPKYVFDENYFFPRIWSFGDERHAQFYRNYLGLGNTEKPSAIDNYRFFFSYQLNWMYWRYFMWNYVGRQNDVEGQGEAQNGNWVSGIKFIDKMFGRGDADLMPDDLKNNKARNEYYFLPFILGILGCVYHYKKNKHDWIVNILFFFFTGIAIQLYINNTPIQPRERDYAYVSAYAYAIWIGLGVVWLSEFLRKYIKNGTAAPAVATAVSLVAVPTLMLSQNWDDHNRHEKTIARDHARNALNNCDSNAILITFGDNDTYPLWYLQEIEGYRTDIRIVNANLLGTDWQNDQLFNKVNDADAVPMIWAKGSYTGSLLERAYVVEHPKVDKNQYFSLEDVIAYVSNPKNRIYRNGDSLSVIPTKNFKITIDKEALIKSGLVDPNEYQLIPEEIRFNASQSNYNRGDLSIMNMIAGQAKTGWKRPIYMTDGVQNFGLDDYFKYEGTLRKFVPVNSNLPYKGLPLFTNVDKNINMFLNDFTYGGANGDNIYYDEKNRILFIVYRQKVAQFASYLSIIGRQADAKKILNDYMQKVSESSLAYTVNSNDRGSMLMVIEAYYRAGDMASAQKYGNRVIQNLVQDMAYYKDLGEKINNNGMNGALLQMDKQSINSLIQIAMQNGDAATAQRWSNESGVQVQGMEQQMIQSQSQGLPMGDTQSPAVQPQTTP